MSALTIFNFKGHDVRTVVIDGDPWFVAADVCAVLEIGNPSQAMSRLDDDERTLISNEGSTDQQLNAVSESGLFSLVLGSRKAEAKRFKKWVTSEVLPSIRKTGSYGTQAPNIADPATLRTILLGYTEKVLELEGKVAEQAPAVAAQKLLEGADGSMCVTDAAKALKVRPKDLFAWLSQHQWLYRRPGNTGWLGYQARIQSGHVEHKVTTVERSDGSEKVVEQVRITAKGVAKLAEIFGGGTHKEAA